MKMEGDFCVCLRFGRIQEKKYTAEEKEIEDSMKVFARFHSPEEHELFVEGLISE